jgi:hypothetical protein
MKGSRHLTKLTWMPQIASMAHFSLCIMMNEMMNESPRSRAGVGCHPESNKGVQ